jgi:5-methyltetrahydropteroyltriglutamate--homocysteine methyltransferase
VFPSAVALGGRGQPIGGSRSHSMVSAGRRRPWRGGEEQTKGALQLQTTVVGNYPKIGPGARAPSLRAAIQRYQAGRISEDDLQGVAAQVTREVLADQAKAGLDVVTDGHIRWDDPYTYFASKIDGFDLNGLIRYFDSNTYFRQPVAERKLEWTGPITVSDYRFAAENSAKPVKAVVVGPYTLARQSSRPHYNRLQEVVMDLASILNREARALADAGAPLVQFDEPAILRHKDDFPMFKEAMSRLVDGVSSKTALYAYCGDISGLAKEFLSLPFDVIGLDFVTGPTNFDLLSEFPSDKELGLGIVDARNTKLETVDEIVDQIRRASNSVGLDRIDVSPSCGLEFLPRANAYGKLVRMVEGVARAQEVLS